MTTTHPYVRMVLISESEYARLLKLATPAAVTKTSTSQLPPDQEQKLNARALEEERNAIEQETQAQQQQPVINPLSETMLRTIIDKFPVYARARGHSILQKLIASHITWDGLGRIQLPDDDTPLANTHIVDLIHYGSNTRNTSRIAPVGWPVIESIIGPLPSISQSAVKRREPAAVPPPPPSIKKAVIRPTGIVTRKRRRIEIPIDYAAV